jgi:hypothetical protein
LLAKSKLKRALDEIDVAKRKLKNLMNNLDDNQAIRIVIRELEDAEDDIEKAIMELKFMD